VSSASLEAAFLALTAPDAPAQPVRTSDLAGASR
jgi:hypothetical protein